MQLLPNFFKPQTIRNSKNKRVKQEARSPNLTELSSYPSLAKVWPPAGEVGAGTRILRRCLGNFVHAVLPGTCQIPLRYNFVFGRSRESS